MVLAQSIAILTASYETVANVLGHMFYALATNPNVQEDIFNEVIDICNQNSEVIDHETIKDMHLLEAQCLIWLIFLSLMFGFWNVKP